MTKPNLFAYDDYRKYLVDVFAFLKETKRGFSFRFFSREAGFASPNFLQLVMKGKRNLTSESVPKFARALKLGKAEAEFFDALVFFNQADTSEEKTRFYTRMTRSRRYREVHQLEKDQFRYFSRWFYAAVRELLLLPDFREEPDWIARKLYPSITAREAQEALELLLELRLAERDAGGGLRQVERTVSSGAEVRSLAVKNFHKEMLKNAALTLDRVPPAERDVSGAMMAIPEARVGELKEAVARFRKEILAMAASFGEPADRLYQLNLQLFPLSKGGKSE
jgi:uncharacterized protein (TIGR02147 family)